jgi:TM2 domain-containing membrane protein YozV
MIGKSASKLNLAAAGFGPGSPNKDVFMSNLLVKQSLSTQQLALLESEMASRRKNVAVAVLLAFFLGGFGAHRFYLGQNGRGILMLCVTLGIVFLSAITLGVGAVLLFIPGLWSLIDCFLMSGAVARVNQAEESRILASMGVAGNAVPVPA